MKLKYYQVNKEYEPSHKPINILNSSVILISHYFHYSQVLRWWRKLTVQTWSSCWTCFICSIWMEIWPLTSRSCCHMLVSVCILLLL